MPLEGEGWGAAALGFTLLFAHPEWRSFFQQSGVRVSRPNPALTGGGARSWCWQLPLLGKWLMQSINTVLLLFFSCCLL